MKHPRIVVIGGGTGSFTLLQGLKKYTSDLTALVNMADDGGSTGVLRDELGVLPPGDVRQCLVALSDSPKIRDLFDYRFSEGGLKGHSFGNLFLSTVETMTNSFSQAIELASEILRICGRVLPITTDNVQLAVRLPNGRKVVGEHQIANMKFSKGPRPELFLAPKADINPTAKEAIKSADIVIIAPGNLYGSLAPALIVDGVGSALERTKATVVYVCNLVTKPQQTDGFSVQDYADEIERFAGGKVLDVVLYNNEEPPADLKDRYIRDGEFIIKFDPSRQTLYQALGLPLIDEKPVKSKPGDAIAHVRSLIRHDSEAVVRAIMKLQINR